MEYVKIATRKDFEDTRLKSYRLLGRLVAIFRQDDGSFLATEGACKHQGADLTAGELRGAVVTCPRHQWQYDLLSGQCLNHDSLPLRRYGVKTDGDSILVTLTPLEE